MRLGTSFWEPGEALRSTGCTDAAAMCFALNPSNSFVRVAPHADTFERYERILWKP